MLVVAAFHWGHGEKPVCGVPTAEYGPMPASIIGYADSDACRIVVRYGLPKRLFCALMIHEMGHLYGREHSTDRSSVMFPELTERSTPWWCRKAFRR